MKKIGDKIYLTEEEVSPSYRFPDCVTITDIPLCNVCKNWNGPGKCKKLGESPAAYKGWEKRDCLEAVLDTETFGFPQFAELYPEDTKKLLERQERLGLV
ncbi:MAG: hypothetical protein HFF53_11675 [Lawsonibacter sp.]|nr:hypothetical protein [Lawsonibacter sp.]